MVGPPADFDTDPPGDTEPPFAEAVSEDDAFLAHVERVMASESSVRKRQPAVSPVHRDSSVTQPSVVPTPSLDDQCTVPNVRQVLKCGRCDWSVECLTPDAERFVRAGCLL